MKPKHRKLYDELGVDPNASAEEIKQAHRQRAKESHPDTGGSREEFQRVQTAYLVLSNKKRRAKYDEDGTDDISPATDESEALGILHQAFGDVVDGLINSDQEPTAANLTQMVQNAISNRIRQIKVEVATLGKRERKYKAVAERFVKKKDGANFLRRHFEDKARDVEKQKDGGMHMIGVLEKASEMLKTYEFKFDQPPMTSGFFVSNVSFTNTSTT